MGDISSLASVFTEELQRRSLGHELKGLMLTYMMSSRQEQEVMEAKNKMKEVDDNLAGIEKEYAATKDKLGKEIENLRSSRDGKIAKLKREYEDKIKTA
ncbi:hypothetical protein A2U01_0066860, partial [Trifolium medium]|nr:hypothetical protein [Trifolium medium]